MPSPADIRAARDAAGLTQAQAAESVGLGAGERWAEYENGKRSPDVARWALFLLLTGQHPGFKLSRRRKG
jgi:putative transcriptional regulator